MLIVSGNLEKGVCIGKTRARERYGKMLAKYGLVEPLLLYFEACSVYVLFAARLLTIKWACRPWKVTLLSVFATKSGIFALIVRLKFAKRGEVALDFWDGI